mmetsp:Transcript_71814/g.199305  ORF Transcript_71814/g.199305 Transcript_71814/m.199305 type:complete len:201 (+) Transcript_71814:789-1391(+)
MSGRDKLFAMPPHVAGGAAAVLPAEIGVGPLTMPPAPTAEATAAGARGAAGAPRGPAPWDGIAPAGLVPTAAAFKPPPRTTLSLPRAGACVGSIWGGRPACFGDAKCLVIQGCPRTFCVIQRCSGCLCSKQCTKWQASFENQGGKGYSTLSTLSMNSSDDRFVMQKNGVRPDKSSYNITPRLHKSTGNPWPSLSSTSGAM